MANNKNKLETASVGLKTQVTDATGRPCAYTKANEASNLWPRHLRNIKEAQENGTHLPQISTKDLDSCF